MGVLYAASVIGLTFIIERGLALRVAKVMPSEVKSALETCRTTEDLPMLRRIYTTCHEVGAEEQDDRVNTAELPVQLLRAFVKELRVGTVKHRVRREKSAEEQHFRREKQPHAGDRRPARPSRRWLRPELGAIRRASIAEPHALGISSAGGAEGDVDSVQNG